LLCWISSVVFVRCILLALIGAKERKNDFFLSLPERTCQHFFLGIPFPGGKTGKIGKKKLFLSLPERTKGYALEKQRSRSSLVILGLVGDR